MAAVAAHKGIRPERLEASVEGRTAFSGREATTHFTSHLDLGTGLTRREQRILYSSACQCKVHKMLRGEILFEEQLLDRSY